MDDVLAAGTNLQWTEQTASVEEVEEKFGFPQIVKTTAKTSQDYKLPEAEPVLLLNKRKIIRVVAQTIEEGHYVMGKQIEIPDSFNGLFKVTNDYERDEVPLKHFRSVQEVSDAFPRKVYVHEQLTVTLISEESSGKFNTVVLQKGDELTIVSRSESLTGQGIVSKPASRIIGRIRRSQHTVLVVHSTRLNESLSLPMSMQGQFSTRPPDLFSTAERKGLITMRQVLDKGNFPMTVIVSSNSTRSTKDEFVLRSGMHLKLIGLEEHNIVLGVTPFQRIVEFSSANVSFFLPFVVASMSDDTVEQTAARNKYQTYVQSAFLYSKVQNSASNVDEHCASVRIYIPRNIRSTNPKPLANLGCLRSFSLSPLNQRRLLNASGQGMSAIQLLSQSPENTMQRGNRTNSRRSSRRQLPTPDGLSLSGANGNPPLPPRNLPFTSASLTPISKYDPSLPFIPPVPPKRPSSGPPALSNAPFSGRPVPEIPGLPLDMPQRPPPEPGTCTTVPADMPRRPAPEPNINDMTVVTPLSAPEIHENIFEEFYPQYPSELPKQSSCDDPTTTEMAGAGMAETEELPIPPVRRKSAAVVTKLEQLPALKGGYPAIVIDNDQRSSSPSFSLTPNDQAVIVQNVTADVYENLGTDEGFGSELQSPYAAAEDVSANPNRQDESEVVGPEVADDASAEQESTSNPQTNEKEIDVPEIVASENYQISVLNGVASTEDIATISFVSDETSDALPQVKPPSKTYVLPPGDWTPPDDVPSLTVDEVANCLRYVGIAEEVAMAFQKERIDGVMLTELTDEILEQDFHLGKLYRHKIKRFLQGWRPKLSK